MKFSQEQQEELREMASEHRKLIDFILSGLCEWQESDVLKVRAMEKDQLSYEMARLEGARKLAVEFRRLITPPVQKADKKSF